jgi:tRNA(Ile)-lysidine synthase
MYTKVKEHIVTNQLIKEGEKLLLAVSGGADSMAMLDVVSRLSSDFRFSFMVVTVDHGLRGKESEADRLFVEQYCETRAIPVIGQTVDVIGYKKQHQVGTQVAAREMRYQVFQDVMKAHDCETLVLAHHADDQVESLVMQLIKSTDPRKLTGMPEVRAFGDKRLIRPFLHVGKTDIYHYVKKRQIPYREDPSNADDHYRRNAVRHHVIPHLKQFNPEVLKTTDVLMSHLKEDNDYLMKVAQERFDEWVEKRQDNQEVSIDISVVKKEARALQRRLFHLILNYLYDTLPSRLSYKHETAFFSLLQHTDGQRSVDLPDGLVMRQVYDRLLFCFKDQHTCETPVNSQGASFNQGQWSFEATNVSEKKDATKDCLYLSYALYHQGMYHVRTRKAGDKIYLPELNGHKKVSRIFIDQKIPQDQRDHWPLLVDQHDHVVWVMGLTKPFIQTHVEAKQYVKLTYQKKSF